MPLARADAHERKPVAMRGIHVGLYLEHKAGKIRIERIYLALLGHARTGRERKAQKPLEERLDAKVVDRAAKEHGRQFASGQALYVELIACAFEQFNFIAQLAQV